MVPGLQPGANVIAVFPSAHAAKPYASVQVSASVGPQLGCEGMTALAIPPSLLESPSDVVEITLAQAVAATSALPGHCRIRGRINPRIGVNDTPFAIGFELRMPDRWSGRFFFQGGGGNDGSVGSATGSPGFSGPQALARGMASTLTDGGHTGGSAAQFGFDPQARIDHAYNAFGKTAATTKAIIDLYYGRVPDKSYFAGCSGGGRQGMMFTQRYPNYFDGVVAAEPAMRVATGASISSAWESITYRSIAPTDSNGAPILAQSFSNEDLTLVANKILAQCDALDGVADGSVSNFQACKFDPAVLQCAGAKDATCLTGDQVGALKKGFGGPVDSSGKALYFPWQFDAGVGAGGWRVWKIGSSPTATPNSAFSSLIQDAMRNEFFTPPDPTFSIFDFNFRGGRRNEPGCG
jgi:feruloyl esterase